MRKKLVVLKPDSGEGNPYIDIVKRCLKDEGYEVIAPRMALLPAYIFRRVYVANFNWYENVEWKNFYATQYIVTKRKLMFFYLKHIRGCKIIVTVHNRKNHHAVDSRYSEKMLAWLVNKADAVVILCDETRNYLNDFVMNYGCHQINEKIWKIGIPNYVDVYRHSSEDEFWKIRGKKEGESFELAYFGTISQYKNVEIIYKLATRLRDKKIHITVAGGGDATYLKKIEEKLSLLDNVTFSGKFIPDESIWGFIKGADWILLP